MEQMTIAAKQMIDFQKATLDSMLGNMLLYFEQAEKVSMALIDQAGWLPDEGKKVLTDWVKTNRRGVEQFKQVVEDGFSRVERCFVRAAEPAQAQM